MPKAPKVFVSHASEDKERFVLDFARKLRERGIEAWVDKWEMLPGDSLVDKIFEEGIKDADAVIIVLSNSSIRKPWVREELNASIVKRINNKARVIPVVIDECDIPESLQSTLYERIEDLQNYDSSLDRITAAIYGVTEKPPLGSAPKYVQLQVDKVPGLSTTDTVVLKTACELSLQDGDEWVVTSKFVEALKQMGVSEEEIADSINILEDRGLIETQRVMGDTIPFFKITPHGFENYAKFFLENFDELISKTLLSILNYNLSMSGQIAEHLGKPIVLIEYILDILARRKLVKIMKFMGGDKGSIMVHEVTSQGRRVAREP